MLGLSLIDDLAGRKVLMISLATDAEVCPKAVASFSNCGRNIQLDYLRFTRP